MYGKIIDGKLIEAPEEYVLDNGTVIKKFNRSIEQMLNHGFKPVIDSKPGYDVDFQYCNFAGYLDTGRYIRYQWVVEDIEPSEEEVLIEESQKAMEMLNMDFASQVQTLSDEMALEVPSVFPKWQAGMEYEVGFKIRHNDILYKVLQTHTSQEDWAPNVTPSLYAKVVVGEIDPDTGEQEILDWVQPGSTNPYMAGDKVLFNGIVYESTVDNNVWSPAEYPAGWRVVEEE